MNNNFASTTRKELIDTIHRYEEKIDELQKEIDGLLKPRDTPKNTPPDLLDRFIELEKILHEKNRIIDELNNIILDYQTSSEELKAEIERLSKPKITPCPYPDEYPSSLKESGYILVMRLLQSDLVLDDREMAACAEFTKPEIIRAVLCDKKESQ